MLIEADDLHLPIDKPVKMLLRSIDVLHDFYVAEFRSKMDMIPGVGHLFLVHPHPHRTSSRCSAPSSAAPAIPTCAAASWSTPQEDYDAWLAGQQTYAQLYAPEVLEDGQLSTKAAGLRGRDLQHQAKCEEAL